MYDYFSYKNINTVYSFCQFAVLYRIFAAFATTLCVIFMSCVIFHVRGHAFDIANQLSAVCY